MKIKILLVLFSFFLLGMGVSVAQTTQKIGHVNVQELVQSHPALDSLQAILEQETKDMEEVYADMLEDQQAKMDVFDKESAGYSEVMKKAKQDELLQLSQKIQNYNQTAQQQLRQRNMQLIQPIYENVTEAIKAVSKEKGLTYVLDISNGMVAYIAPDAIDITPLVKERLEK